MNEADAAERKRKNLLELLFPKAAKRAEQRKQREQLRKFEVQRVERKKSAPPIKKVEGAKYYTYKVEGFRDLKLAGIIKAAAAVTAPVLEPISQPIIGNPIIGNPINEHPLKNAAAPIEPIEPIKPTAPIENAKVKKDVDLTPDLTVEMAVSPQELASINALAFETIDSVPGTTNVLGKSMVEEKSTVDDVAVDMKIHIQPDDAVIALNEIVNTQAADAVANIDVSVEPLNTAPLNADPLKTIPIEDQAPAQELAAVSPAGLAETSSEELPKGPHILAVAGLKKATLRGESKLLSQVESHYLKNPEYMWIDRQYGLKPVVEVIFNVFETADAYGLDPASYQLPSIEKLIGDGLDLEQAATQFELSLSVNILRYMADANSGVINPNKISGYHDFKAYNRNYKKHLNALTKADLPAKAMFDAHPSNQHFKNLKSELEMLLESEDDNTLEPIAAGTLLKPGNTNAELPKVIAAISKFGSKDFLTQNSEFFTNYSGSQNYDDATVEMVKAYQAEKKLTPDGIVGSQTLKTLKVVSVKSKILKLNLAMERLRWLPNNFGQRHVFINQPAYRASYIVNGKSKLSMRAIVGKKANQTNFFYDTIESVEFNPYWNVPRSILVNEKLSRLQADPYYYQARGYEVVRHGGKPVNPASINWYDDASTKKYYVRQLPGAKNALGELKILFPNKHNIYMHDTPSRSLFKRSKRALSHGCIRLHKPRDMAAAVMQTSVKQVSSFINAGENKAMRVPNKLPVYVSYFTAFPRSNGNIGYYSDIYGRDVALKKALKAISTARAKAVTS